MNFYKEKETNNVVSEDSLKNKDNYILLTANTTDGAIEKHIPTYRVEDGKLKVQVGEIEHPMEENHYIMWVAQVYGEKVIKKDLKPLDRPVVEFDYLPCEIYIYCNIHGLWKVDVV